MIHLPHGIRRTWVPKDPYSDESAIEAWDLGDGRPVLDAFDVEEFSPGQTEVMADGRLQRQGTLIEPKFFLRPTGSVSVGWPMPDEGADRLKIDHDADYKTDEDNTDRFETVMTTTIEVFVPKEVVMEAAEAEFVTAADGESLLLTKKIKRQTVIDMATKGLAPKVAAVLDGAVNVTTDIVTGSDRGFVVIFEVVLEGEDQ